MQKERKQRAWVGQTEWLDLLVHWGETSKIILSMGIHFHEMKLQSSIK